MRHLRSFIAAAPVALATGLAPALASAEAVPLSAEQPRASALDLALAHEVVTIDGLDRVRPGERVSMVLPYAGGAIELDLEPYSVRSIDFAVWVQDADGVRPVVPPPSRTYRGTIVGFPESLAVGSIVDGTFTGKLRIADDAPWVVVEPLADHVAGAGPREHLMVSQADMLPHGGTCGAEEGVLDPAAPDRPQADEGARPAPAAAGGHECGPGCTHHAKAAAGTSSFTARDTAIMTATGPAGPARGAGAPSGEIAEGGLVEVADILIDADFQFFLQSGGSVSNTVADIENVMAGVSLVYERDVDLAWEITGVFVRSSPDINPYTSSDAGQLLNQFADEWNAPGVSTIRRDVAHLFTGRNLIGSTIGVAFLGSVCNTGLAYGLSQSNFNSFYDARVSLTAHELGHNYNATHCVGGSCHIMCANLDGCGGTFGNDLKFGFSAQNEIEGFAASRTCLEVVPPPLSPPFADDFAGSTIDESNWSWFVDAQIVTDPPFDPPSGPNAVELRSFSDIPFRQGDLRSNVIDLGGESGFLIQFAVARTGLEAGEGLSVEYRTAGDAWNQLFFLPSDGSDADFQQFTLPLPPPAYHPDFRIRFRLDGNDFGDRILLDDIFIGVPEEEPCPGDADGNGAVDFDDLLTTLSSFGPCDDCPADFDEDGDVDFDDLLTVVSAFGACP